MTTLLKSLTLFSLLLFASCEKNPPITDGLLDGNVIFDPAVNNPEGYYISAKYPNPTPQDLEKHIIIAIHGYTASTFEWQEFVDWTDAAYGDTGPYRVSQILMGAHGTTYEAFKASKWQDWAESAKVEYQKLVDLGYTKISLVGSSTGATVCLEMIHSGFFNSTIAPQNVFIVDGIIVSSIKTQSIANIVGPMLVYVESNQAAEQDSFWYRFRPQETVRELNKMMKEGRKELESSIIAPEGTRVKVYHSANDPTASSTSAVLIYKGLKHADGSNIDVQIMESDIHVFTRLALREFEGLTVTQKQRDNQKSCFQDMASKLN